MAVLQAWVVGILLSAIVVVEIRGLYFQQVWSRSRPTLQIAAARREPWTVLFCGSSQVFNGIVPAAVEAGLTRGGLRHEIAFNMGIYGGVAPTHLFAYRVARRRHHPSFVVIGLSPRDLNASYPDHLKQAVMNSANFREAVQFATRDPPRRWALPWYVVGRDLAVPLQALYALSPPVTTRLLATAEQRGARWGAATGIDAPPDPTNTRLQRVRVLASELANYDPMDFPEYVIALVNEARQDGAQAVILVMPVSVAGARSLPDASAPFESALAHIRDTTGVEVRYGTELAPELAGDAYYWDQVDHLTAEGAQRLSLAMGEELARLSTVRPGTAGETVGPGAGSASRQP
jgi:hypothetical protein